MHRTSHTRLPMCCAPACWRSAAAIHALERAGILTWVNRLVRIREVGADLFGQAANRWRVIRTSNGYAFTDPNPGARGPQPSKSESTTGTPTQELKSLQISTKPAGTRPQ